MLTSPIRAVDTSSIRGSEGLWCGRDIPTAMPRHSPSPCYLPRHQSACNAMSSIRGIVAPCAQLCRRPCRRHTFIFFIFSLYIYYFVFFHNINVPSVTKKTYPDGISIAPLTDVPAAVPHSDAGEGGTPRSCVPGACASHHAFTTVGGPKATPSGIATPQIHRPV